MAFGDVQWMKKHAIRDNILFEPHSYIPIVLEDIPKYISLLDYEENCIKDVHTIGSIRKETTSDLYLQCITPNVNIELPIKLQEIASKQLWGKKEHETDNPVLANGNAFRMFGTLRNISGVTVLDVNRLVKLECPMDSLRILSLQSRMAQRQYKQFYRTPELDELLQSAWGVMRRRASRRGGRRVNKRKLP